MNVDQKSLKRKDRNFVIVSAIVLIGLSIWSEVTPKIYYLSNRSVIIGIIMALISPFVVLWFQKLWNTVVPDITGWRAITFVEALGLIALALILV